MLCIVYVTAVGALLGTIGLLVERLLPPTAPRRWIWLIIIPVSMFVPDYYRNHHNWSVTGALEHHAANPTGSAVQSSSFALLDPAWWSTIRDCDPIINKLWIITSGLLLIWGLVNAMRVSEIIGTSTRDDDTGDPIIDGVRVVVTEQVGPATVGLLRSHLLVPRWVLALPRTERGYVLRHEDEHRRAHDAHLLFIASLPLLLMPWNAAMWWLLRRLCLAVEMDCDNRVVSRLGNANAYGELLLKVAEAASRGPRLQPAFLGSGMLEKRLSALVAPEPLRAMQRFLLPAAALALFCVVLWMPHPIVGTGSHAHRADAMTTVARQN